MPAMKPGQTSVVVDDLVIRLVQEWKTPEPLRGHLGGMSLEMPPGLPQAEHYLILRCGEDVIRVDGFAAEVLLMMLERMVRSGYSMPRLAAPQLAAVRAVELDGQSGALAPESSSTDRAEPGPYAIPSSETDA